MPFVANGKEVMLNALTAVADFASLHTANPGASGANEVSGGSPAYARQGITWNAASGSSATGLSLPTFDVPASTTVAFVGLWNESVAGTFYGYADVTDEVFAGQGTYEITAFTLSITDS